MEGQGVINYAAADNHRPSYAFSGATTEFDDALLQRGIVTRDQVLLSKGMSVADAERLLQQSSSGQQQQQHESTNSTSVEGQLRDERKINQSEFTDDGDDEDDSDFEDNEDDAFLQEYRRKRMMELQEESSTAAGTVPKRRTFGEVVYIDRTEWIRHVNEDSVDGTWVVVCLTSSDTERTGRVEAIIAKELAAEHPATKFVLIPSHSAIANWPDANLPSLFLYRHGTMQHELIRLPVDLTREQLEETLTELNVLGREYN